MDIITLIWTLVLSLVVILLALLSGFAGFLVVVWDWLRHGRKKRRFYGSPPDFKSYIFHEPRDAEKEYGESSATLDMQDEEDKV